jgi:acetyl esterase/lipase
MKIRKFLMLVCLPVFLTKLLAQPAELRTPMLPEDAIVHRDLAYVSNGHERQKLDLYLPKEGTNLPLIIYIHGGAFRMGSKEQGVPTEYLSLGYAVASINYRLSQHAKFPAQIEDCKAAVRWLRANAARFRLDPNRFAAWGASAGGHLVAMLGTTGDVKEFDVGENLDQSSRVQAVVDYFGPTDFLQMDDHRLPDGMVHNTPDSPESQLIGGPLQENKDKIAKANPITYVTPDDPPFLIVHGDSDPLVPHHQSELLEAALKKAGVPVIFYTVKGGGHGGFRDPKVPELTRDFLNKYLKSATGQPRREGKARQISGIYPHLAVFNESGECGIGAVVPWADKLWLVTYAPHEPIGSSDKLYEITPDLTQIIRPESIGGTPANRMIHRESHQLFIGPYVIGADRTVRVIPYTKMFGRLTGNARHLFDPANKIYYATMEEGIYEVDIKTLEVTELWTDEQLNQNSRWKRQADKNPRFANLPGYHGKGFYSGQGLLVYANNGEHGAEAQRRPDIPSGVLAQWDGKAPEWTIVRRNQFTEVTGPGGIYGNQNPATDPIWSIGWDHRSLILMLLDGRKWHSFRLPKASHCYDGAHGWNTEWPRIRDIGESTLLMTMHGCFWKFPKTFTAANSAGISPRSTYLKVIADFCRWGDQIVFGCDDTAKSEFLNKHPLKGDLAAPGKSQSNLWFVDPPQLDRLGPLLGRGAVWLNDDVKAGSRSEPFLFSGFSKRSLILSHNTAKPVVFTLEVDVRGNGNWTKLREITVAPRGNKWIEFAPTESGAWVRLAVNRDASKVTAFFHYRGDDNRFAAAAPLFDGIAKPGETNISGGLLYVRGETLRFIARNPAGELGCYDLDGELRLIKTNDPAGASWTAKAVAIPPSLITVDAASVLYVEPNGKRWRLPKGDPAFDKDGPLGAARVCREVVTERNLLNIHGTFYEMPAENAGGFSKLRPIATHNRRIHDFASYRGMLVISGIADDASGEHIIRSDDGKCALWVGVIDDLWLFGKPRGVLGAWNNTPVRAGIPSDPCLATGYDNKKLTISHTSSESVTFRLQADFTGTGDWTDYTTLTVEPGKTLTYKFPDSFGAYWLRLVSDKNTTATATFIYD